MRVGELEGTCTGRTLYDLWQPKLTKASILSALDDGNKDYGIVVATIINRPGGRMKAMTDAGFKSVGTYQGVHGTIAVMIKGLSPKGRNSRA